MVRDILGGEPSVLLRKEIYVTAAAAGAALSPLVTATSVLARLNPFWYPQNLAQFCRELARALPASPLAVEADQHTSPRV